MMMPRRRNTLTGRRDSSPRKGPCCQPWWPEFNPKAYIVEEEKWLPQVVYELNIHTVTHVHASALSYMHTHTHKYINVMKNEWINTYFRMGKLSLGPITPGHINDPPLSFLTTNLVNFCGIKQWNFFPCVCVWYIRMWVSLCVLIVLCSLYMCVCEGRPEVNVACHSLEAVHLAIETGILLWDLGFIN